MSKSNPGSFITLFITIAIFILFAFSSNISAQLGYDNPTLPRLESPTDLSAPSNDSTLTGNPFDQDLNTTDTVEFSKIGVGKPNDSTLISAEIKANTGGQGVRIESDASNILGLSSFVTGDSQVRFTFRTDGLLGWGNGSASTDVNLFRTSADVLRTNDAFVVDEGLSVGTTSLAGTGNILVDGNVSVGGDVDLTSGNPQRILIGDLDPEEDYSGANLVINQTGSIVQPGISIYSPFQTGSLKIGMDNFGATIATTDENLFFNIGGNNPLYLLSSGAGIGNDIDFLIGGNAFRNRFRISTTQTNPMAVWSMPETGGLGLIFTNVNDRTNNWEYPAFDHPTLIQTANSTLSADGEGGGSQFTGEEFRIFTLGDDKDIMLDPSSSNVVIGNGSQQVNLTLTSPDGTEWNCGVDNSGTFSCS